MMQPEEFPRCSAIWPGCLLASVAHAVFVCRAPFMAHEHSWDGRNYNVQDSAGSRATIAFGPHTGQFVAAFFLKASPRNPFLTRGKKRLDQPLDQLVPSHMQELAKNATDYLLQYLDDAPVPIVTSAFWSSATGDHVESHDTWRDALDHGASLVTKELLSTAVALNAWTTELDLTSVDTELVREIFEHRNNARDGQTNLISEHKDHLQRIARGAAGLHACKEALRGVQVFWQLRATI